MDAGSARVELELNGEPTTLDIPVRQSLADAVRAHGATGTRVGCEHGVCGACTVLLDGEPVRSCLIFAISVNGRSVTTVEGLADGDELNPAQRAFGECHALQCGFCTPGFLTTITAGLAENPRPTREEAVAMIAGNLCRCTGYHNIVDAVLRAAELTPERP
jgi:carbon-monoxide dehydrogenase small subunit